MIKSNALFSMIFKDPHIQKTIELLKEPKKLYWGMLAAVVSAGMTALIPLIYGRSIDIAVQPESDASEKASLAAYAFKVGYFKHAG